ncbi:MAG TPA: hypothetical protein DDW45_00205 [Gammaproteobacteria bacterium]|nr:hypothetical protein [Gammaproteobacteria bacterium]
MTKISNDTELRQALKKLDRMQLREVSAAFVESVLHLSSDKRVANAIDVARNRDSSDDELLAAYKAARVATVDSRTRCGADCNWEEQAAHFVARASAAMVAPEGVCKAADPPWQVVMSCRMAQNCALIAADDDSANDESENQYRVINDYLDSQ